MAHLSGTFSSPYAGKLLVWLTGSFYDGTSRDAGFNSTTANMSIRGVVNGNNTHPIDRNSPVSFMKLDYPGGNVSWAVSTQEVAYTFGGLIGTMGMQNLNIVLQLVKK